MNIKNYKVPKHYEWKISGEYSKDYICDVMNDILHICNDFTHWKISTHFNPIHYEWVISIDEVVW